MKKEEKGLFPTIQKTIESFIEDDEASIPAGRLLTIGTLVVLLGSILSMTAFAKHSSHSSHSSHTSHSSTSYHRSHVSHTSHRNTHSNHSSSHGSHSSHANHSNSHSSHGSHDSHSTHTSHSNTSTHSNSNYSVGGDYGTPEAPKASGILAPPSPTPLRQAVEIPDLNTALATPETSMVGADAVLVKPLQVPLDTPKVEIDKPPKADIPETPVD